MPDSGSPRADICKQFGELIRKHQSHKSWVFTLHNYTEKELKTLHSLECTRKCIGKEITDNQVPHLQGLIVFRKNYRFSALQKISPRAHWEKCISVSHAWNYCLKEGNFYTEDNRHQGSRQSTYDYRDRIKEGATDRQLCDEFPCEFLRFSRTDKMRAAYQGKRHHRTTATWIYGEAGLGKSPYLVEKYPDACWLEYDGKYFSHYNNADIVIMDDQNFGNMSRELILKLVNCTPYKLRVMGAYQEFNSKKIIFCSNFHWDTFWNDEPAIRNRLGDGEIFGHRGKSKPGLISDFFVDDINNDRKFSETVL